MGWALARRALVTAELLWTAALVAAAAAASHAQPHSFARALSAVCYAAGSLICHQRPERSFHLWAVQLPVCARCTGIYAGAAFAGIVPGIRRITRPQLLLGLFALPAVATLVYEWTTGRTPSNLLRAATGVLIGAAVMAVLRGELRGE